jgi:hypothetical protein
MKRFATIEVVNTALPRVQLFAEGGNIKLYNEVPVKYLNAMMLS